MPIRRLQVVFALTLLVGGAIWASAFGSSHVPVAAVSIQVGQAPLGPREILDHVDDLYRGESSHGQLHHDGDDRALEADARNRVLEQGQDRVAVPNPRPEEGSRAPRRFAPGNDIWNYLPRVNRVIKLPSSMMSASWMGSHFTNDDLVKETPHGRRLLVRITVRRRPRRTTRRRADVRPEAQAAVVWGKVVVTVDRERYLPIEIRYFDEDRSLARTLTFSDVSTLGGRELPTVLTRRAARQAGRIDRDPLREAGVRRAAPDDFFSLRTLQR